MASCEKILIAGFSGAGKSCFLKSLKPHAPKNWDVFDDLDHLIFKKHGKGHATLSSLIEVEGWRKFRVWEKEELESWLQKSGKGILALGGGTLTSQIWNRFGKNPKIKFCYLEVSFEVAWNRLLKDQSVPRPLLKLGEKRLMEIYLDRVEIFNQINWRLNGNDTLSDLASQFWKEIRPE